MAGGGGAFKKNIINFIVDKPAHAYLLLGGTLAALRQYQVQATYNKHFGKIDFERKVARGELWRTSLLWSQRLVWLS